MKILSINPQNPEKNIIHEAIEVMEKGGIVVYPTDTIYGLAVNIFDENALKRLYDLKNRSSSKPLSICVSNLEYISKIAHVEENIKNKISELLPGPFTIILKKKNVISPVLTAGGENIGIRIPDTVLCQELSRKFPITASSANISGMKTGDTVEDIISQLGSGVDLILDAGSSPSQEPSTVIDFTQYPPEILRQGSGKFVWP